MLRHDLRRNETDADLMDIDINVHGAEFALDHVHDWVKPRREATPIVMFPPHVRVRRDPLGVTLVIGAWNEPFMLTIGPLISAIAAGNTAVVKPSEVSEGSAAVVAEMIPKFLDPDAVAVVTGGVPETTALLDQHWDLIFFTGSPAIGKIIHQAAAKHLRFPPCSSWAARTRQSSTPRPTSSRRHAGSHTGASRTRATSAPLQTTCSSGPTSRTSSSLT